MKFKKYIVGILCVFFLVFMILIGRGNIGVSKNNIEKDARKAHRIPEKWITANDVNNNLGVLLFYSEDLSKFTFSIYQNKQGLSFGYTFRSGGALPEISDEILKVTSNGHGEIFLSLNKMGVSRIEIYDGEHTKEILIEDNKPFTVIIPENSGEIKFYNIDGHSLPENIVKERPL
ncbi:hypothetical protein R0131_14370 [Clostridium sp. AL.422]|uniref:hypothetical protein n=1 Tax=Clostridium TaxID=1485 RepID=UPI00293DE513|nr:MULTISPECIES: hypothetical protein [unclassified Clostridium]MDV4152010.1 hypothetical protein [Clostridium sp. AL.422]